MEKHDTVGMLIEKEGRILLIKRLNEPKKGFWAIPGGHVDPGETPEIAVIRETEEEISGCRIDGPMKLVFDYDVEGSDSAFDGGPHRHTCYMFHGREVSPVKTGSDAGECAWLRPEDALKENVTPSSRRIIEWYIRSKRTKNQ